ncbi:MAG: zeta toxin family protein [Nitrospirae bacterium]|nr:zeta toxin family protein [Nitrospirota bacterium]
MKRRRRPVVVVLAGPNGAGKSTVGPRLLKETLRVVEFINTDTIALGLSAFRPEGAAIEAGRVMLRRFEELAHKRENFAVESTLAGRTLAPRLAGLKKRGYKIHIIFIRLASDALAIERVADRVRSGGHNIPIDVIRRRYRRGLRNFFHFYMPLADDWRLYDNSGPVGPRLVAFGRKKLKIHVMEPAVWRIVEEGAS